MIQGKKISLKGDIIQTKIFGKYGINKKSQRKASSMGQ